MPTPASPSPPAAAPLLLTPAQARVNRRRLVMRTVLATLGAALLLLVLGAGLFARAGWYNVGAVDQHWRAFYWVVEKTMQYSVRHHAAGVGTPPLTLPMARRGLAVYQANCQQCHGAPGIAPDSAGLSMQPEPGPLVHMWRRWRPSEIYWIVRNGIKMSGMPAWQAHLSEDDMWAVVALVEQLPVLSPADYAGLESGPAVAARRSENGPAYRLTPVSAERGRIAVTQYACQSCHVIAGIVGSSVQVGPRLEHYAQRRYVAGYLPNTPANLARWLRFPQQIKPGSAMPQLGLSQRDADDIAAYLLAN